MASVWFADEYDENENYENYENYYEYDENEMDTHIPDEFSVFVADAEDADTDDDEKACAVFLQTRKAKRGLFRGRGQKGKSRVGSGFRKGWGRSPAKGWQSDGGWNQPQQSNRPGAWLSRIPKGHAKGSKTGFSKGFANPKGYGKAFKGFGKPKGFGKGKKGKKGKFQRRW